MKKFYLKQLVLFIVLFSCLINAQNRTYTQAMDSLLVYLDRTQQASPILHDRVFSFSDIDRSVKDTVSTDYFIQSWSELYRAHNNPDFFSPEELKTSAEASAKVNKVEFGLLNLKYTILNFGDQSNPNINMNDGFFRNVPGKNPFTEKTISIVAPISSQINSNVVEFSFPSDYTTQDLSIPSVVSVLVDFDNGITKSFPVSNTINTGRLFPPITGPFTITYTSSGLKNLKFTQFYSDNTSKISYSSINVNIPLTASAPSGSFNEYEDFTGNTGITQTIPFQGYGETSAKSGVLEYRTYYNTLATSNPGFDPNTRTFSTQPKLRNPIYVLDGYDPGDTNKFKELFYSLYYDNKSFINQLQDEGFDVTLVNFPNGADYIERNAMAVVALLQRESSKLVQNASSNQITLVGPSMGGMVARYALAYMEKQGIPHNTKLYVSYDAPHLGANIPISAQNNLYFYGFIGGNEVAKTKYSENFFSPAAREMLIEQLDASNPMKGSGGQYNNDPLRNTFIQNLNNNGVQNSNGFPLQTRNIAIANGTTNSTKNVNDGQCLLEMAAFKKILGFNYKAATFVDYAMPSYNSNALNFEGKFTKVGKFTNGYILSIDILTPKIYRTNTNSHGSMDAVQGSKYNTMMIIKDAFEEPLNQLTSFHEWRQGPYFHTFMPTVSTLAFKNSNFNWNDNISRNLLCNNEIPFKTYYASSQDDSHVAFDINIATWLNEELLGNQQLPYFPIDASQFTGATTICTNDTSVYSFPDICKIPGNATWSVTSNLQIISSTGTSVNIKGIGNGSATITATFQNGEILTKAIWVGLPKFNVVPSPNNTNYVTFNLVSDDPNATLDFQGLLPTNVTWRRLDNNQIKTGFLYFYAGPNYNYSFDVEIKATNSCGTFTTYATIQPPAPPSCDAYNIVESSAQQNDYIIIDPCSGSSSTSKNISAANSYSSSSKLDNITTIVTDIHGNIIINTKSIGFNINNQPLGTYYAKIIKNGKVVHTQTLLKN